MSDNFHCMFGEQNNDWDAPRGYHIGMSIFTGLIALGLIVYAFWGLSENYYLIPTMRGASEVEGGAVEWMFVSLMGFAGLILFSIPCRFMEKCGPIKALMGACALLWLVGGIGSFIVEISS